MMSLVAYDNSDESGEENEDDGNDPKPPQHVSPLESNAARGMSRAEPEVLGAKDDPEPMKTGLFSLLPAPKRNTTPEVIPEDPVPRNPPKKEPVKIMIPSLKEFEDDEQEEKLKEKRKPSKVGSGLICLLPEPQNLTMKETAKQLVPLSVSRKTNLPKPAPTKPPVKDAGTTKVPTVSASPSSKFPDGNESDEETPVTDFFSLSEKKELEMPTSDVLPEHNSNSSYELKNHETCSLSSDYANAISTESCSTSSAYYSPVNDSSNTHYNMTMNTGYDNVYPQRQTYEVNGPQEYDFSVPAEDSGIPTLKNEAIVRLAGKKRSGQENIEFVDVNGDDLVAGRDEWLLKSLSETDSYQPAPKRSDQPSAMHRRKHQITYLAFQAKAREQELKNQWSMNRMTKKQTQSKYGF